MTLTNNNKQQQQQQEYEHLCHILVPMLITSKHGMTMVATVSKMELSKKVEKKSAFDSDYMSRLILKGKLLVLSLQIIISIVGLVLSIYTTLQHKSSLIVAHRTFVLYCYFHSLLALCLFAWCVIVILWMEECFTRYTKMGILLVILICCDILFRGV